jgi:hypothetical protein
VDDNLYLRTNIFNSKNTSKSKFVVMSILDNLVGMVIGGMKSWIISSDDRSSGMLCEPVCICCLASKTTVPAMSITTGWTCHARSPCCIIARQVICY